MKLLDERKIRILQAIVTDYVTTTRPVGSERLIEAYQIGCKSATVRNEMAEMVELGYLVQPHTSAGRIPTDRGYRYYVDELMDPPAALSPDDQRRARAAASQSDIAAIMAETLRLLSGLTSYPSVATEPAADVTLLRRVYLSEASPRHLLLVTLLSTGHVEHSLVESSEIPPESMLSAISGFLNEQIAGSELETLSQSRNPLPVPPELFPHTKVISQLMTHLRKMARALSGRRIYMEGTSQFLRQPEFQDVQRLESLLNALEQRNRLFEVLSQARNEGEVTFIIGIENRYEPLQECSFVSTTYQIGDRTAGSLGVVGPTRMNYDRSAAAVGLMARHLSEMLTNLYLA